MFRGLYLWCSTGCTLAKDCMLWLSVGWSRLDGTVTRHGAHEVAGSAHTTEPLSEVILAVLTWPLTQGLGMHTLHTVALSLITLCTCCAYWGALFCSIWRRPKSVIEEWISVDGRWNWSCRCSVVYIILCCNIFVKFSLVKYFVAYLHIVLQLIRAFTISFMFLVLSGC